jgi:hypothetical protein
MGVGQVRSLKLFPGDQALCYLARDRDGMYGIVFRRWLRAMGIRDWQIAPRSPWRNGLVERLIGSVRCEGKPIRDAC